MSNLRSLAILAVVILSCSSFALAQAPDGLKRVSGLQLVDANGVVIGDITGQFTGAFQTDAPSVFFSYQGRLLRLNTRNGYIPEDTIPNYSVPGYYWYRQAVYFSGSDCTGNASIPQSQSVFGTASSVVDFAEAATLWVGTGVVESGGISSVINYFTDPDTKVVTFECRNYPSTQVGNFQTAVRSVDLATMYVEPFRLAGTGGRGDANGNGKIEPSDIMYLINYLFAGGQEP